MAADGGSGLQGSRINGNTLSDSQRGYFHSPARFFTKSLRMQLACPDTGQNNDDCMELANTPGKNAQQDKIQSH